MAAQGGGAEDARTTEGQQRDGNLEHRAEGGHRHELEAVVGARLDQDVEGVVEALQEPDRRREHDDVSEGRTSGEERGRSDKQRSHRAPLGRSDGRRDERPRLSKEERQSKQERESEGDRDRGRERLAETERDRRARLARASERLAALSEPAAVSADRRSAGASEDACASRVKASALRASAWGSSTPEPCAAELVSS